MNSNNVNNLKISKVSLKYMSAVSKVVPVATIPVSASEMEKLDLSIKEKCKQNAYERQESNILAKKYLVK